VFNDKKYETLQRQKIDPTTKVANFHDQEMLINITENEYSTARENYTLSLKLQAVSETKSKLIGLYQLRINTQDF
jgi:hypothetical protein